MRDTITVMQKELMETVMMTGGKSRLGLLFQLVVFGVVVPLQVGTPWIESPIALMYWAWIPLYLTNGVVADAFAGERERKTLETLLASRLSDSSILYGKIIAGVIFGWGLTLANVMAGLITVNLMYGQGRTIMYEPAYGITIILISLLMSILAAVVGVLLSLRAASVRQAAQSFGVAITVLFFAPVVAFQLMSNDARLEVVHLMEAANWMQIGLLGLALVVGVNAGLFMLAQARFKRYKLILD